MRRIYQNAESVLVWLGLEYNRSGTAIQLAGDLNKLSHKEIVALIRDPARTEHLEALVVLFRRQYWWRIWVIQEVSCAKKAMVYCGPDAIPWVELDNLSDILRQHDSLLRDLFYEHPSYIRTLTHGGPRGLQLSRYSPNVDAPPLLELLLCHKSKKSTDPKDKVYALVGISSSRYTFGNIDYSHSLKDIFTHTAKHIITSSNRLDVICVKQHVTGRGNLPSWAPDWTRPPPNYGSLSVGLHHHEPPFNADGNTTAQYEFSHHGDALKATGFKIDTIKQVAMPFKQKGAPKNVGPALLVFHDWWNLFASSFSNANSLTCQAAFGRTISCGNWMFEGLEHLYEEKLNAIFKYGSLASSVTSLLDDNAEPVEEMIEKEQVSAIIDASVTMNRRRFFVTQSGAVGLAPWNALEGDTVCVLLGCRYPVILREVDGHYVLVGEAYVDGFMNGEALVGTGKETHVPDIFEIH
ncbi:hypothetical protein BGZ60DRAFT_381685 [Tricladium varicosporioides]|nr:hypothetical protein BGZ60DRAFT_381685 [Hymenoscyphus varicosporioides]